jgi:glutathione S-transferase
MITVYHLENSRSQRVLWMLEELGLHYAEGSLISKGADKALLGPQITNHLAFLEGELNRREWFAGSEFTAANVQMSFPIKAADARVGFAGRLPRLKGFVERVQARPAYKRALERGGTQMFLK